MKKLIIIAFALCFSSIFAQEKLILSSDIVPHADTSLVFVPKDYNGTSNYPLLFMLHGWSGNYNQWNDVTGGLQSYADKYKFIIICPDGFYDSWYLDSPVKANSQFETFFFKTLVPNLFDKYKIDKSRIFITGLSMGGHGAMTLLLKHPDFFKSAGSTSGILDITAFPDRWSMLNALGKYSEKPDNWTKNSALFLIKNIKGLDKELIIDCGTEDFAYNVNKAFNEKCIETKIKITFISQPGAHTREYWKSTIDNHFRFFARLANVNCGL
ncbi:MAG: alpha/beta hydrolase family protein [Bacteroidota bacterium]|nr:alpha/beta hydrolase family protein [Bacteroidota bacterium]MDP4192592.1 alpha/beta hydrolase family protein [Bacteroidota bacterium]